MAYENPSPVGHKALVEEILRYACALNALGTPVYTGTGNGQLLNLRAGWALSPAWNLELRGNNLGDEVYQPAWGFNAAGRAWYLSLAWIP